MTIDTLRADRVTPTLMPALTGLAATGTSFTRARTVAPLTLPAHVSLMTGLYPPRSGVRLNGVHALAPGVPRLAQWLQQARYDTAAFVGAYVLDRRFGLAEGFATYDDRIPRAAGALDRLEAERRGDEVVTRALAWLSASERSSTRPVFVWTHLYDPHAPYAPPAAFATRGAHAYDGEVAFADAQLARLLAAFASSGRGQPLVVVAGDHGESLGDHGEPTHGMLLYESAVRVPLVVAGPGVPRATTTDPVSLVDIAPTVAGKAGAPFPAGLDGVDLFADAPARADRAVFGESEYPRLAGWASLAMIADARWKAIVSGGPELYDLSQDSAETTDLASARRETASALARQVGQWRTAGSAATAAPLSAEAADRLRALGYVAATPTNAGDGGINPATRMEAWSRFERALADVTAGRRDAALPVLGALAREHPESALFATSQARILAEAGRHREALGIFRRAAARRPGDAMMLHDLAVSARAAGLLDEALKAEQAALVLDPANALAHNGLGLVLADLQRHAEARRAFEQAAAADPTNATYRVHVGNAARGAGDLRAAETAYREALALDDGLADALNGLGVVLVQTGRAREAVAFLERAVGAEATFVEARLNLGIALQESGDLAGARAAYLQVRAAPARFARERAVAAALLDGLTGRAGATR